MREDDLARSPDAWTRRDLFLALLVTLAAVAARLGGLDLVPIGDELAMVEPPSLAFIFGSGETVVNPPLLRLVVNLAPGEGALWVGRGISLVAGSLAAGGVALLARRLGASPTGALLAGLWVAFDPLTVEHGALARSYAWWSLAAVVHLEAVRRVLLDPDDRGWRADLPALLSGATMVWLHYLSVPILLAEGLAVAALRAVAWRRWARIYVGAALAFAPLAAIILTHPSGHTVPPSKGVLETLEYIVGYGYGPPVLPSSIWDAMVEAMKHRATLLVLGALHLLSWFRLLSAPDRVRRFGLVVVAGQVGVLASIAIFGQVQSVRPPVAILWLVFTAPTLVAGGHPPPRPRARVAQYARLLVLAWFVVGGRANKAEILDRERAWRTDEAAIVRGLFTPEVLGDDPVVWVAEQGRLKGVHALVDGATWLQPDGEGEVVYERLRLPGALGGAEVRWWYPHDPPPPSGLVLTFKGAPVEGCQSVAAGREVRAFRCP